MPGQLSYQEPIRLHLSDGDGTGVELSLETADRGDRVIPGTGVGRTDGRQHGPVRALDVEAIVEAFPALVTDRPMPPGTRVGHNQFHVADLAAAASFYENLGFAPNPSFMRTRDFNARGSFLHRLALDEWQGRVAPPAPSDAAGLHHLQLTYGDHSALGEARATLDRHGAVLHPLGHRPGVSVADPSGTTIELTGPAG